MPGANPQSSSPQLSPPLEGQTPRSTRPVDAQNRVPLSSIRIELCTIDDTPTIVDQLYACYPPSAWAAVELPELRQEGEEARRRRFATRLSGSFGLAEMRWVKAVVEGGEKGEEKVAGVAGWMAPAPPNTPIHIYLRRSATDFYDFQRTMNWTDDDVADMWTGIDLSIWEPRFAANDAQREEFMRGEPHWYLAQLTV